MAQIWNTVRIFISSTFRDMHAERDQLVKVLFPELRERCEKRQLHLIDIDLRRSAFGLPIEKYKYLIGDYHDQGERNTAPVELPLTYW